MATARAERRRALSRVLALVLVMALPWLAGCASAPPAAPSTGPARIALPFSRAVPALTVSLLANAQLGAPDAGGRYPMMVDPWIDQGSGMPVEATRPIEAQIAAQLRRSYPQVELLSFGAAGLARQPLVLLGALAPVPEAEGGRAGGYRIRAVIGDLRSGRIVSQAEVWTWPDGVNLRPTPFFRNSPAWVPEQGAEGYARTVGSRIGDPIDPEYLRQLRVAALVNDGIRAYEAGRYRQALAAYEEASRLPGGEQIRVYNGLYLANRALRQPLGAEAAFRGLVKLGLASGRLSVRFVFRPGSAEFWRDPAVSGAYEMWLREIARQTAAGPGCLEVIGHASPSGPAEANLRLSQQRAERVRDRLVAMQPGLGGRLASRGAGASEPIIGSGADDASDLLDRRVEFRPVACTAPPS